MPPNGSLSGSTVSSMDITRAIITAGTVIDTEGIENEMICKYIYDGLLNSLLSIEYLLCRIVISICIVCISHFISIFTSFHFRSYDVDFAHFFSLLFLDPEDDPNGFAIQINNTSNT